MPDPCTAYVTVDCDVVVRALYYVKGVVDVYFWFWTGPYCFGIWYVDDLVGLCVCC